MRIKPVVDLEYHRENNRVLNGPFMQCLALERHIVGKPKPPSQSAESRGAPVTFIYSSTVTLDEPWCIKGHDVEREDILSLYQLRGYHFLQV